MKRLLISLLFISVLYACNNQAEKKEEIIVIDTAKVSVEIIDGISHQDSITATGIQALTLLKAKNYPELVKYFAPEGVLFSPYGNINKSAIKLSPDDFLNKLANKQVLNWGDFDGTGNPINLTIQAYLNKFVYTADFLNAEAVGVNEVIKQGNSINNIKTFYPNNYFIDYHFSGFEQKNNGMDWVSLRLVFEKQNGQYFIVAIIHDQWTV